ncbi:MAG: hypothetical protein KDD53_03370 [Bdellovibrionales bacterium]|nr:hypothetical protein [Bdellovibrionales bacterium]
MGEIAEALPIGDLVVTERPHEVVEADSALLTPPSDHTKKVLIITRQDHERQVLILGRTWPTSRQISHIMHLHSPSCEVCLERLSRGTHDG